MTHRTRIALWSVLGFFALAVLGVAIYIATFDLKGFIEARGGAATGRDLSVGGDIDIDWGWVPRITLDQVTLSNAEWSDTPQMAEIEQVTVAVDLRSLLRGRIVLPELRFRRPVVTLERNPDGDANWTFQPPAAAPDDRGEVPVIEHLAIEDGEIAYRDAVRNVDVRSEVSTVVGEGGAEERVQLSGEGTLAGEPFSVELEGGGLLRLRDRDEPYPLKGSARVGDTAAEVEGTLLQPGDRGGMDLTLAIAGDNVGALFPIIGLPAPTTPPYDVTGRLTRQGDVWRFEGFSGRVGDSDLAGDLVFDTGGERLMITGDLRSERLDFDDLGGLVGAPPGIGPEETAAPGQAQRAETEAGGRLLPNTPIDFEKVRTVDARVTFQGDSVQAPGLPLEGVDLEVVLDHGVLRLEPLHVGVAGGRIAANVVLDAREDTVITEVDARLSGFRLEEVLEGAGGAGEIFGRARLQGAGNSVAVAAGAADGDVALMMNDGTFSSLMIELIGLDAAEALGASLSEDETVPIRCTVLDFAVEDGVMRSRALVVDTTDSNISGEAAVDLGKEAYEVRLLAHPKDPSLFSARAPVTVAGDSFREFDIGVDAGALGLRAAAAVALGAILTPLASARAFIEPGTGEDSPCNALIQGAERNAAQPPAEGGDVAPPAAAD